MTCRWHYARAVAEADGSRAGWSAAWVGVAALTGGFGGAFWNDVATTGPRFLVWPACVLSVVAVASLYLCFAVLGGWWPARRLESGAAAAAPTLIGRGLLETASALPSSEAIARQYARARLVMLRRVRHRWITGVLEPSLAGAARLVLGWQRRPGSP